MTVLQDLRYALRTLSRTPGLVAAAVICLALGIGANATIFGVIDTLLFRPPPHVQHPGSVRRLYVRTNQPPFGTRTHALTGYPLYAAIRDRAPAFDQLAAFTSSQRASLGRGADAQRVDLALASASFFALLGVRPTLGRFFTPDEDRPGGPAIVVLSYRFWWSGFGGDSAIIGRQLHLGRSSYTVIGVAPDRFTGVNLQNVDVWAPLAAAAPELMGPRSLLNHGYYFLQIIGRVEEGAAATAAQQATFVLRADDVYSDRDPGAAVLLGPIHLARGPERSQNAKVSIWLAAVSLIVLLIACANVANLLLARALTRRRELAVRLALGSGWWRLSRQVLAESVLLGILGGMAALLVALWGGPLIRAFLLPDIPASSTPLDGRVVLGTALIAILTGLLASAVPAWELRRRDFTPVLKAGAGEGRYQRSRLRAGLLVAQIALTVVLIVGAGLFARSLRNVEGQDFGLDPLHTLIVTTNLRTAGHTSAEMNRMHLLMLERLQALPGIASAAATVGHPFERAERICNVSVPGRNSIPRLSSGGPYCQRVTADYFSAMGTPVRGRSFSPADRTAPVAIINETMAGVLWPHENAIGKCFVRDKICMEIVGVVPDARFRAVAPASMLYYVPFAGGSDDFITAIVARVHGRADDYVAPVRAAMQSTIANTPYVNVTPVVDLIAPSVRPWRLGSTMFGAFALLALMLSAVGLYGVLAHTAAQRTHEMGVRLALGAQHVDVVRLMLKHGVGIAALGAVIGAVIALAAGGVLASLMYGVSPRDPLVLFVAALMPIVIAVLASYLPARRAARVDPVTALRYE